MNLNVVSLRVSRKSFCSGPREVQLCPSVQPIRAAELAHAKIILKSHKGSR